MWCQWDKRDALEEKEEDAGGVVVVVGGGDGSHIEMGEVWRGRWREKEGRGG